MEIEINEKEKKALEFINERRDQRNGPVSVSQVQNKLGLSEKETQEILWSLQEKEFITFTTFLRAFVPAAAHIQSENAYAMTKKGMETLKGLRK